MGRFGRDDEGVWLKLSGLARGEVGRSFFEFSFLAVGVVEKGAQLEQRYFFAPGPLIK